MRHAKYAEYNQSFFGKIAVGEIAWQYRDKHPTVYIKYKGTGHTAEDPFMEASFSPIIKESMGRNIPDDVRRFFFTLDRFVSIYAVRVEYDGTEPNERLEEIYFETDFPN
jgi:hypothetical protein